MTAWAVLAALAFPAPASVPAPAEAVAALHAHSRAQAQAGFMARHKAEDPRLRRLGDRLTRDYDMIDQALHALAERRHILPQPRRRSPARAADLKALERLRGPAFDRRFADSVARSQDELIAELEAALPALEDPELASFIERILPLAREHWRLAAWLKEDA